ncbi:MAG: class I SAM-dependent rRNA methyltransferase [Acidobacteriota bacterium]|nr:class I SAM-dependent rRNA methyltransferase [Acidobacteriota bacterium]
MPQAEVRITSRAIDRIAAGHPWIYRSDVKEDAGIEPGAIVRMLDRRNRYWGQALYSVSSQIALRLLTREERVFDRDYLEERILQAAAFRGLIAAGAEAYRVVSSEGDQLPSLIIDRYGDCFAVQTLSQGMERLKSQVVGILEDRFHARSIIERNDAAVRKLEGLPEITGMLRGSEHEVVASENGVKFKFDLLAGQKTGGFLDQRENRAAAREYAHGRALDCFCYQGGFALQMAQRCESVIGVDSSGEALKSAHDNQDLNGSANVEWREANCFDFLKAADHAGERFDTVVVDPPAFARTRRHLDAALGAYKELNLRAMKILNAGGFLITCSCSHHVSEADFLGALASAAVDAHRTVTVVERRTQARDHPILLTVPETHYLKCMILRMD